MDLLNTIKGSLLEGFFPAGWDLGKMDLCCANPPESITRYQDFWHEGFKVVPCGDIHEFNTYMGHEIAMEIGAITKETLWTRKIRDVFRTPWNKLSTDHWES